MKKFMQMITAQARNTLRQASLRMYPATRGAE